ncbi:MAG: hypothetical protein HFF06_01760 [Oscillospiraceae bacterium]|jgi:hypothetical protein|nr:hypothetical protein [Oscillospiraceae bacterium]
MNKTLVKVRKMDKYLYFCTITKERKSPHSFMISTGVLDDLYDLTTAILCEYDCGSFARIWRDPLRKTVHIRFYWLHSDGVRFEGWEQTIIIPFQELMAFNKGYMGDTWSFLSLENYHGPKLVFCKTDNLHSAVNNPVVRKKLSRFLRDNFRWPDWDEIRFYNDLIPYSFFFQTVRDGRIGISGGVILHEQDNMKKAQYALHT